ncbi:hypothetical protein J19TS2_59180 [Cohnella xylanilytica]|nr:hypothetical protein J19TS2_59180 [Cohnella xylanilytica]
MQATEWAQQRSLWCCSFCSSSFFAPDTEATNPTPSSSYGQVVISMGYPVGGGAGYGMGAAAFALVLFILLVIILRAGYGGY